MNVESLVKILLPFYRYVFAWDIDSIEVIVRVRCLL